MAHVMNIPSPLRSLYRWDRYRDINLPIMNRSLYRFVHYKDRKLHLLFRVLCTCEPYVLSIPNGISRTERHSNVVRILRPFNFSFLFCVRVCVRARARTVSGHLNGYRSLLLYFSTRIHNYPPNFFQKTNTGSLRRIVVTIHLGSRNC